MYCTNKSRYPTRTDVEQKPENIVKNLIWWRLTALLTPF